MKVKVMSKKYFTPTSCRSLLVTALKIYLDCQYFLFCCPFRLVIAKDGHCATTKSNIIHKCICFVYKILGLFWTIRSLQTSSLPSNSNDPSLLLGLALDIDTAYIKIATVRRYWRGEENLLQIANFILDPDNDLPIPQTRRSLLLKAVLWISTSFACILLTGMGVAHFFTGSLYYVRSSETAANSTLHWNRSCWWNRMLHDGRVIFFMDPQPPNASIEVVAAVLATVGHLWRLVLGATEELFCLIVVIALWVIANEFEKRLQHSRIAKLDKPTKAHTWTEISREYEAIKTLADLMNHILGWTLLGMVVQTALYNSVNADIFLKASRTSWTKTVAFTTYSLSVSVIFLFAADISRKVFTCT